MPLNNYYQTITIKRVTKPKTDGDWGTLTQATTSTTDVGFIQPVSGSETFAEGKGAERVEYRMFMDNNATELVYGDLITQGGKNYIVLFSGNRTGVAGVSHHREVLLGVVK